jgi:hypothetical protein
MPSVWCGDRIELMFVMEVEWEEGTATKTSEKSETATKTSEKSQKRIPS